MKGLALYLKIMVNILLEITFNPFRTTWINLETGDIMKEKPNDRNHG